MTASSGEPAPGFAPPPAVNRRRKVRLLTEFLLLYLALPTACYFLVQVYLPRRVPMIPILVVAALAGLAAILTDRSFPRRQLWNASGAKGQMLRILAIFVLAAGALAVGVWLLTPQRWLEFPLRRSGVWMIVMVAYPVLSVFPQELLYRAFLFHRYRSLFPRPWAMVTASALAFGYMHVVFGNPVAVILSTVGGFLFAWTYQRSKSLLAASIEHALYGDLIFTVGLGWYFYHGTIRAMGG